MPNRLEAPSRACYKTPRGTGSCTENQGGAAMRSTRLAVTAVVSFVVLSAPPATAGDAPLDYDYYKSRVEPVFLSKREGHARCFVCHIDSNNAFRLQKMSDSKSHTWTEEESRKNFTLVS